MKSLESLVSKLLDFLNFGTLVTILIPGLAISFCLTMLISQLLFPVPGVKLNDNYQSTNFSTAIQNASSVVKPVNEKTGNVIFREQIKQDYKRLSAVYVVFWVIAIISGLMLYNAGFLLLENFKENKLIKNEEFKLHPYVMEKDLDGHPKFDFDQNQEEVTLGYFAPFLKEKLSGNSNYLDFIVIEYYRYVEFAMVMPLAIFASSILSSSYYLLFSWRNSYWPYSTEIVFFLFFVILINTIYIFLVVPRLQAYYYRARKDIIKGVSNYMDKTLDKTLDEKSDKKLK